MLDENLPGEHLQTTVYDSADALAAFFFNKSEDGIKHYTSILSSYRGSEPALTYTLKHADPVAIVSRNCYAAALFDAHNPEVLYGEVLLRPQWVQPTVSQDELRRNRGVAPPPIPKTPTEFVVQLYNPDQQIVFSVKTGSWGGSTSYEFSVPQTSFREPSGSTLDRSQSDPAAYLTTPRYNLIWRRDRLSKDYTAYMTGRPTDAASRKKGKDPDIALALFRSLRELTIYESNLTRLELEDAKGLEIVFLLSAATIRDVFAGSNIREAFNIGDQSPSAMEVPLTPVSATTPSSAASSKTKAAAADGRPKRASVPPPKMPDARAQWELDAETARLAAIAERERKDFERQKAKIKREREEKDEAERLRLLRMVQEEERAAQKKQKAIDAETERLRRQYGSQPIVPTLPSRKSPPNSWTAQLPQRPASSHGPSLSQRLSQSAWMSGGLLSPQSPPSGNVAKKKSSIWSKLTEDGNGRPRDGDNRLSKKASAMW